jgi:hypothetical protein
MVKCAAEHALELPDSTPEFALQSLPLIAIRDQDLDPNWMLQAPKFTTGVPNRDSHAPSTGDPQPSNAAGDSVTDEISHLIFSRLETALVPTLKPAPEALGLSERGG